MPRHSPYALRSLIVLLALIALPVLDICFSFLLYSIFKVQHYVQLNVEHGGGKESRTPDPLLARQVLYQLSYTPIIYIIKTKLTEFST